MKLKYSRGGGLILVVASLIFTVVVSEGASRLFFFLHWHGHLYRFDSTNYSLRLGWELAPGSYADFHINGQGFRHPKEIALAPQHNTVRIFLVGGSTAFGSNGLYPQVRAAPLTDKDTIDYHLQTVLSARHKDRQFEVINAGVSEYRLFQEATLFREKLVNFQPHLVIFFDGHNDISFLASGGAKLKHQPQPYWESRHVVRAQRVLNPSGILAPLYYLDIYLGRVSYFYHGLSTLFQRLQGIPVVLAREASANTSSWGDGAFRPTDEESLRERYKEKLRDLDEILHLYLDQVQDLKAIAAGRKAKIAYVLQPEIVAEEPSHLTDKETVIQQIAFRHHGDLGSLGWRYLAKKIAVSVDGLRDDKFEFVNLVRIAGESSADMYTDYCHLTSNGNHMVAEKLYPAVVKLLDLNPL